MTEKANASDNPGKFREMLTRRARKGQCYHQPYFGTREFPASFRLVENDEEIQPYPITQDLGLMLYDMDYRNLQNITPRFSGRNWSMESLISGTARCTNDPAGTGEIL